MTLHFHVLILMWESISECFPKEHSLLLLLAVSDRQEEVDKNEKRRSMRVSLEEGRHCKWKYDTRCECLVSLFNFHFTPKTVGGWF